jgi:hypothetical protein
VPSDLVTALSGIVVVLVVSLEYLRRRARAQSTAFAGTRDANLPRLPGREPPMAVTGGPDR